MNPYTKALTTVLELGDLPNEVLEEVASELLRMGQYHLAVTERNPERKAYYDNKRKALRMLGEVAVAIMEGNKKLEQLVEKRRRDD